MALDADRVVVAEERADGGRAIAPVDGNCNVAGYNADSSLDAVGYALAIDPDGDILLGGASAGDLALGRVDGHGNVDGGFGQYGDGVAAATGITGSQRINGLVALADGAIVAAGSSGTDFIIAKFDDGGTLDTSFGTSGYTTTDFTGTDSAYALMMQPDGKFVAAGVSNSGDFAVARFDAAGALDTSFNSTGKVTADFALGADAAYALAIGPDYKITVAGTGGPCGDFAAARFKVAGGLEQRLYVLTDRNFNVTAVTDVFGVVKERFVL